MSVVQGVLTQVTVQLKIKGNLNDSFVYTSYNSWKFD